MRITLVSTYTHPVALGLRYVSAYLKAASHEVEMLFMCSRHDTAKADFSPALLDEFVERLRGRDLIGMGLMTNTFHRARVLTERIRAAGIATPIIWGGTHPTVAPEESVEIADIVCVGEGEEAVLELAARLSAGRDPRDIANLWFRAGGLFGNGQTVRNPVRPLDTQLDDLPLPDYELETHLVAGRDGFEAARAGNLRGTLERFRILSTRGCPYHCTFCNNAAWQEIYRGRGKWVRKRSNDNVIAEMRRAVLCFPQIESFNIVDDLFLVRREAEIENFVEKYRQYIGLPLQLDAFPNTITEAKVRALKRVPLELISMGIESASADTLDRLYQRPTTLTKIAESIDILQRHRVRAEYHYLVNNPYEPDRNLIETMRFIASKHKGRAVLRVFPLMFYPGTPLYRRARADGLIGPRHEMAYDYMYTGSLQFAGDNYLAIWLRVVLYLRHGGCSDWLLQQLIDFVTHRWVRTCLDRKWFPPAVFGTYFVLRKVVKNLFYQPFLKPFTYLRSGRRKQRRPHGESVPWRVPQIEGLAERFCASPATGRPSAEPSEALT
ncbi:MAG: B12-binding domain-containing radical SAM protein [Planctomycetes bacterium]|nr:B12-binding domain-containing radical SAM protein [Planctomycetota bacterium]